MTTITVECNDGGGAIWHHAFQGPNTAWLFEQRVISGNFFLGLQGHTTSLFQPQIPRGAIIESAHMTVEAHTTNGALYTTFLNTPARTGSKIKEPLSNISSPFTGWRPDQWSNANVTLLNTMAGLELQTSGGADNSSWILRQLDFHGYGTVGSVGRDRMAQRFTPSSTFTLGTAVVQMSRNNLPLGNIRCHIMEAVAAPQGGLQPSEVILASSNEVAMTSIPILSTSQPFVFSGPDAITLTSGVEYYLVIDPDPYVANNADNIAVHHQNTFFSTGLLEHYGTDQAMTWQNFPGITDAFVAMTTSPIATPVTWVMPIFIANNTYNTPDLADVIQSQVDDISYKSSDRTIIIITTGNSGFTSRIWKSGSAPVGQRPTLTVTYRKRRREVI